jgi:hypothetical protein
MDQQKHTDLMIKQGELDHSWIQGYISGGKSNDEATEAFIKVFGRKPVNMDKYYNGKRICTPEDNCREC